MKKIRWFSLFVFTVCLLGCNASQGIATSSSPSPSSQVPGCNAPQGIATSSSPSPSSQVPLPKVQLIPVNKEAGYRDGPLEVAQFNRPTGLTLDKEGNVYVADTGNHRIRKITPDGMVSTFAGSGPTYLWDADLLFLLPMGYKDGPKEEARFNGPQEV